MPRPAPEANLTEIENIVERHPEGLSIREIEGALAAAVPRRTLQYRLKQLVDAGRLAQLGQRKGTRYIAEAAAATLPRGAVRADSPEANVIPLSSGSMEIRDYLRQPPEARRPVGYDRAFLDAYRPNEGAYLSPEERAHLAAIGKPRIAQQPAGTYVKLILNRLLIDLSWNSSRLEGNTYSLLDTRRLIEFGQEAEGHARLEAQMILNHKDAIEFLSGNPHEIGFNRYTILNLHAMLANNLLPDDTAAGRLRHIGVEIEKSAFHPLEVPQLIEECFDQILATAAAIRDPFEQAFFVMVHLPYLQPFDDVNKRVSRLAANIPLIKHNLAPLSFIDVPRSTYTEAVLGVYEMNRTEILRDMFVWAYERSAHRYAAVQQSLGEPDPFRLKNRAALRDTVSEIVRGGMDRKSALEHIGRRAREVVESGDIERFREMVENDLLSLHEGNYARYQVKPSEFDYWRGIWAEKRK